MDEEVILQFKDAAAIEFSFSEDHFTIIRSCGDVSLINLLKKEFIAYRIKEVGNQGFIHLNFGGFQFSLISESKGYGIILKDWSGISLSTFIPSTENDIKTLHRKSTLDIICSRLHLFLSGRLSTTDILAYIPTFLGFPDFSSSTTQELLISFHKNHDQEILLEEMFGFLEISIELAKRNQPIVTTEVLELQTAKILENISKNREKDCFLLELAFALEKITPVLSISYYKEIAKNSSPNLAYSILKRVLMISKENDTQELSVPFLSQVTKFSKTEIARETWDDIAQISLTIAEHLFNQANQEKKEEFFEPAESAFSICLQSCRNAEQVDSKSVIATSRLGVLEFRKEGFSRASDLLNFSEVLREHLGVEKSQQLREMILLARQKAGVERTIAARILATEEGMIERALILTQRALGDFLFVLERRNLEITDAYCLDVKRLTNFAQSVTKRDQRFENLVQISQKIIQISETGDKSDLIRIRDEFIQTLSPILKFVMILSPTGLLMFGYDFVNREIADDKFSLLSGIFSGITSLIELELKAGKLQRIQSSHGTVYLEHRPNIIGILVVENPTGEIDRAFNNFLERFLQKYSKDLQNWKGELVFEKAIDILKEEFRLL